MTELNCQSIDGEHKKIHVFMDDNNEIKSIALHYIHGGVERYIEIKAKALFRDMYDRYFGDDCEGILKWYGNDIVKYVVRYN